MVIAQNRSVQLQLSHSHQEQHFQLEEFNLPHILPWCRQMLMSWGNKICIENKNCGVDNLEMEELLVFGSKAIIL